MTTPRDDIDGLIERLRSPRMGDSADIACQLDDLALEAATQLDALQSLAKELSDALLAVRPLGGSELFIKRFGQHYADPVYCKAAIEQSHKDRHEAQKGLIRYRRQAEKAEQERDALQARVKELEQERNVQMLRALKATDRALRAEQELDTSNDNHRAMAKQLARIGQERDEAIAALKPFVDVAEEMLSRGWDASNVALALDNPNEPHRVTAGDFFAIRRLAGPEKEGEL